MKLITLALSLFFFLATARPDTPRHPQGNAKITRNEAQHIALKEFPSAHVVSAKLIRTDQKFVWSLTLTTNEKSTTRAEVDAMTGKIVTSGSAKP